MILLVSVFDLLAYLADVRFGEKPSEFALLMACSLIFFFGVSIGVAGKDIIKTTSLARIKANVIKPLRSIYRFFSSKDKRNLGWFQRYFLEGFALLFGLCMGLIVIILEIPYKLKS